MIKFQFNRWNWTVGFQKLSQGYSMWIITFGPFEFVYDEFYTKEQAAEDKKQSLLYQKLLKKQN